MPGTIRVFHHDDQLNKEVEEWQTTAPGYWPADANAEHVRVVTVQIPIAGYVCYVQFTLDAMIDLLQNYLYMPSGDDHPDAMRQIWRALIDRFGPPETD